ncbi:MAG: tetratricopeptide repeat protein [Gloeocapsa sp. UFS-A4-WI-NPMV-4B04]|nr:tetratricopeptide repeat protein [Gloeocapsa sp. UFS-A4-WI-NPMV-4B04]
MTTANVMQLLNFAVKCMEHNEIYCEVGSFQTATSIAALLDHPDKIAYVVEKFDESDIAREKFDKLLQHLSTFNLEEQVFICDQDFEEFSFEFREFKDDARIGVYFYTGANDYRSQILGLLLVKNLLAEQALIIVNSSNGSAVKQANWDFMAAHPQCQMLLDLPTPEDNDSTFWNGIHVLSWDSNRNHNYELSEIKEHCNKTFVQAIHNWQVEFNKQKKTLDSLHKEALALDQYGCYEEAEKIYNEILEQDENRAGVLLNLGTLYYATNRYQLALDTLLKALDLEPSRAVHHYHIGLVLEKVGAIPQAIQAYEEAINLDSEWIDAYNNLGNIFLKAGKIEEAEATYKKAIAAKPEHFGSYLNLGNVLMEQHQVDEAVETYEKALHLKPRDPDILHNLGVALDAKNAPAQAALYYGYSYYRKGQYQEAIEQYQQFLETQTGDVHFYIALADCYKSLNQYEETIKTYQQGIQLYPTSAEIYFFLALGLRDFGRTQEAITFATEASQLLPNNLILKLEKQFLLPIIYETEEEVDFYRQQFTQSLEELQQISLDTPEAKSSALMAVGIGTNFYLQYQGKNDIEPQKQYGQFVNQVMAANYPQWSNPLTMLPLHQGEKIRVGYVSAYLRNHNGARWALGWIQNHNKQNFEIYCYHTGRPIDRVTQQFKLSSDVFYHISDDLEAVCNQIVSDRLHILIFPDIGMEPSTTQMAGLRLAPVQCTAWGHPITSGLPTIDYYLSSDLMEPENAQEHYSEQLIRLPNIGLCYPKPTVPQPIKSRSDFQLRDDSVVYLSCQSLFKYLPRYDYIFPAIVKQVSQAQIAFLAHQSTYITEKFWQRLQRAFASFGLNSEDYCVIVPRQNVLGYLNLNSVSDVYLDTLSWSGGNSTLEAIACNLPIVTCPGEFMRGRHSYAILEMLGVTDTIATSEAEYIEIAVKLGLDKEWRGSIIERMIHHHSNLYNDKTCVEALDTFFCHVVQQD